MEQKIRIQLFNQGGALVSDKLLEQGGAFYSGPKEIHSEGPIRIEFTLIDQRDTEEAIVYLQKLRGILPLEEKLKKRKDATSVDLVSDYLKIEEHIKPENFKTQDDLVFYLRDLGFVFLMEDHLSQLGLPIEIKPLHKEFQWMIKQIKRAKNPKADKYDPTLVIGMAIWGERTEKVVVYLEGKFKKSHKIPVASKPKFTFDHTEMMKFPDFMNDEEREKFRIEHRIYKAHTAQPLSKFYLRWAPYVQIPEIFKLPERTE